MTARLIVPMDDKPSLDELFVFADIDDVSENMHGDVTIEFTLRPQFGSNRLEVSAETIEEALELARTAVRREIRLNMLAEEGLTMADIDKIIAAEEAEDAAAREYHDQYETPYLTADGGTLTQYDASYLTEAEKNEARAWDRGYDAARADLLARLEENGVDPSVVFGHKPAVSEPAVAAAAEPVDAPISGAQLLLDGHPVISVVYMPVAITQSNLLPVTDGTRLLIDSR